MVLWFEADLYDQLQLIQLLDWLQQHPPRSLSLICIAEHHAVPRFAGLGQLTPEQMADLFPIRQSVTPAQLELGRKAWAAFTAPSPLPLVSLLKGDTTALPFLGPALVRAAGRVSIGGRRAATQAMETRVFMGDTVLMTRLSDLRREPGSALGVDRLQLTDMGRAYLGKIADLVRDHGIERWIGGVQLSGHPVPWRWDRRTQAIQPRG